ncbi:serine hydrolase [Streptomyces sp. NPDC008121]|uniref:serine hydrolase n=1 Tax=Streptomyces sp. NPDC008121 TaxID=3364809 RepID=UPI0036EB984B
MARGDPAPAPPAHQLPARRRGRPRVHEDSRLRPAPRPGPCRLLDFVADGPLRLRPGFLCSYSSSGSTAVALLTEAATGRRYEELLNELVYRPLGSRRTSFLLGIRLPRPCLHGYGTAPLPGTRGLQRGRQCLRLAGFPGRALAPVEPTPSSAPARAAPAGPPERPAENSSPSSPAFSLCRPAPGQMPQAWRSSGTQARCGVLYGHTGAISCCAQAAVTTPAAPAHLPSP